MSNQQKECIERPKLPKTRSLLPGTSLAAQTGFSGGAATREDADTATHPGPKPGLSPPSSCSQRSCHGCWRPQEQQKATQASQNLTENPACCLSRAWRRQVSSARVLSRCRQPQQSGSPQWALPWHSPVPPQPQMAKLGWWVPAWHCPRCIKHSE